MGSLDEDVRMPAAAILCVGVEPHRIRACSVWDVMKGFGAPLKDNAVHMQQIHDTLSKPVDSIDVFLSHSWRQQRSHKFLEMAMVFNVAPALVAGGGGCLLGFLLHVSGALPTLQFLSGPSGYASQVLGPACFYAVFFDWGELRRLRRSKFVSPTAFFDRFCINQAHLRAYFVVELVLVTLVVVFGWIGQRQIFDSSPALFASRPRCLEPCASSQGGDNATCYDDISGTCAEALPISCSVYASEQVVTTSFVAADFSDPNVHAKIGVGKAAVGHQITDVNKVCAISKNNCAPITDLVYQKKTHKSWVPYTLIWGLYKLLGLSSLILVQRTPPAGQENSGGQENSAGQDDSVDILFPLPQCAKTWTERVIIGTDNMTRFGRIFELYDKDWACNQLVHNFSNMFLKLKGLFHYIKFVYCPTILVAELVNLEGHPSCDHLTMSFTPDHTIPQVMYYALFTYTVILFALVPVMYHHHDKKSLKDMSRRAALFTAIFTGAYFFIDIGLLFIVGFWAGVSFATWGFTAFIGISFALNFDVKASFSIDVFQLFLGALVMLETFEKLVKLIKTANQKLKKVSGSDAQAPPEVAGVTC